jgi:hypothetical protein
MPRALNRGRPRWNHDELPFAVFPSGRAAVPQTPPESSERETVTRAQLWQIAEAARTFFRRSTQGRRDTDHFISASGALEKALDALPSTVWTG